MNKQKNKNAFTLVELIIVITILAVLATIGFISFQNYTKDARDGNRLATVANVQKGLDTYATQSTKYPEPNGKVLSGSLNNQELTRVGMIGEEIAKIIKINGKTTDPLTGNNYLYGVSADNKYYQIAMILENLNSNNNIVSNTYANNSSYKAKVVGNYNYPLKYNGKIWTLPSLLFTGNGGDLSSNGIHFIINNGSNLPYSLNGTSNNNTQTTQEVLKQLTGTSSVSLTGITIPTLTSTEFKNLPEVEITKLTTSLGVSKEELGLLIYGNDYSGNTAINPNNGTSGSSNDSPANSCSSTLPANSITITGTPTSVGEAWQNTNSANPCYYTCASGYGWNGSSCVLAPACVTGLTEITVGTGANVQTWSCKNLGADSVWSGSDSFACISSTDCSNKPSWVGNYYQWGRNDTGFTVGTGSTYYDWYYAIHNTQSGGLWGGSSNDTPISDGAGTTKIGRQGPCPIGWHVPSVKDWQDVCNTLVGNCTNGMTYNSAITATLKLGLSGRRSRDSLNYIYQGLSSGYWSSSPSGTYSYFFSSDNSKIYPTGISAGRSYAAPVRCVKN